MNTFYKKALEAYKREDFENYFKFLRDGACEGNLYCAGLMGVSCIEELGGFKKDIKLGLNLLEFATSKSHLPSSFMLGTYLYNGLYQVPQDSSRGLILIRRTALAGYSTAQFELNSVYCGMLKFKRAGAWAIVAMQFGNKKAKEFYASASPFKKSTIQLANTIIACINFCASQKLNDREALKISSYYENHEF